MLFLASQARPVWLIDKLKSWVQVQIESGHFEAQWMRVVRPSTVNTLPFPHDQSVHIQYEPHDLMPLAFPRSLPRLTTFRSPAFTFPLPSYNLCLPNMDGITRKLQMSTLTPFARKHKVCVIGSGNWYVEST
jgi:hypothetical protein